MNMNLMHDGKEVIALDADDHLGRPMLIRVNVSELRLFPLRVVCVQTRRLLLSHTA
jgi:hypothetical protein